MVRDLVLRLGFCLSVATVSYPAFAQQTVPAAPAPRESAFADRFQAANTTGDGRLTLAQARAGHLPWVVAHFADIDDGHRGYVTLADIGAYRRDHKTPPGSQPVAAVPAAAGKPDAKAFIARFQHANTTGDGHLTLAQAEAGKMPFVVKNFAAIDTAGRGYVTLADIRAYRLRLKSRRDPQDRQELPSSALQPPAQ